MSHQKFRKFTFQGGVIYFWIIISSTQIINSIQLFSFDWPLMHIFLASHDTKKSFYEIEITRLLSLRSPSVQFAVSQIYNDVISISSKSLSAVQKSWDVHYSTFKNTYFRGKITNQILKIQMPNMLLNDQLGYLLVAK